jgi:hypothetical protein
MCDLMSSHLQLPGESSKNCPINTASDDGTVDVMGIHAERSRNLGMSKW